MRAVNFIPSLGRDNLMSKAERPSATDGATVSRIFAGGIELFVYKNASVYKYIRLNSTQRLKMDAGAS